MIELSQNYIEKGILENVLLGFTYAIKRTA